MTDVEGLIGGTAAPAAQDELAPAAPPRRPRRERAAWVAAFALFAVAVALAALAASFRSELVAERDDRAAIERVAGNLATALLTYDHRDLDGWRTRVLANATGSFRTTFEETFEQSLRPIVTEVKATSTGTVKSIFVSDVDDGSAAVIVVVDTVADGTAGRRRAYDTYIQLDLVETGGRWRVDDVVNLNLGQPATPGAASTGTTAPGASDAGTNN